MAARCPACSTLMVRRRIGGIEVDGCPACAGLWLDKGELQGLAKAPADLRTAASHFKPGMTQAVAAAHSGQCPRCEQPLVQFEFETFRGIRLDRCKQCGGVWLDHGEAEAIAERLAPAQQDAPVAAASGATAPQYFAGVAGGAATPQPAYAVGMAVRGPPPPARSNDPSCTAGLPIVRGRRMGEIDHAPGFLASVERAFQFIKGAYALAFESPKLLVPLAIGGVFQFVAGSAGLLWLRRGLRANGQSFDVPIQTRMIETWMQAHAGAVLGIGLLVMFAIFLANTAILGMTVNMVDAWLKGRSPSLRVALRDVLSNVVALLAMALVTTAIAMLASNNNRRGSIGNAMARAARAAWEVVASLLLPIIMIEDVGFGDAMRRAKAIHSQGLMQIAVGEVGLRAVSGGAMFAVSAVAGLLAWAMWPASPAQLVGILFLWLLVTTVLGVLNAFARGAYYTCLYLWAAELERAPQPGDAMVPAPLASALSN